MYRVLHETSWTKKRPYWALVILGSILLVWTAVAFVLLIVCPDRFRNWVFLVVAIGAAILAAAPWRLWVTSAEPGLVDARLVPAFLIMLLPTYNLARHTNQWSDALPLVGLTARVIIGIAASVIWYRVCQCQSTETRTQNIRFSLVLLGASAIIILQSLSK
jgi:hypothetical protein